MYEVIVMGARRAGASVALLPARRGYRVLMLDRVDLPVRPGGLQHVLRHPGVAALERTERSLGVHTGTVPFAAFPGEH
ncbi:MAG: hypothetical protein AB7G09_13325 [Pseudonocardia sp.]